MLTWQIPTAKTTAVFYTLRRGKSRSVEAISMSHESRWRGRFKSDKWLWIPGIILAIVLTVIVRGMRTAPKANLPTDEPTISVYMHESGEVQNMPLETYLEGVVAAEMDPTWPLEALRAQAIVARTFTLKKMEEGVPKRNTQASTDPNEFQAYNASRVNDRVKQAVKDTRGQIVLYRGQPINAWFHASSGGITASAAEGLGYKKEATPYVAPKNDLQAEPTQTWFRTFSNDQVSRAAAAVGVEVGYVTSIKIGRKGPSGRTETLIINEKEVPAPSFRVALGATEMKSTLLDSVSMSGDSVVMKGRGYGHGVGMSQWGAWLMSQRGKSAEEIVKYYYSNVEIEKQWD
jgi:stage II sporulation protein D